MKRLLLLSLLLAAPAAARTPPQTLAVPASDPRLQTLPYDVNRVVRLNVAPRFQLTVIFSPAEKVENVAIGDSEAWQVTLNNRGDSLFLKSVRPSGVTNMTVITDVRVYNFELSPAFAPGPDTPFTVRFTYPETASQGPAAAVAQPGIGRYRLGGVRALRPAAITDDGVRTTIEWRPQQVIPAVFAIDERGDEILLDGNMRDGRYVIDAIHPTLLFRLEGQTARASRLRVRPAR
jgi:type IV secretion system protein VirB9